MTNRIKLRKFNGKQIDIADELTRYFLGMIDKNFQADWMSCYPVLDGHDRQNISFSFEDSKCSKYILYFADNTNFDNAFIIETTSKYIDNVGIFIPGKTYYWKVVDKNTLESSEIDYFKILDAPTRWISAGSVYNMRDIGGWETVDGKRVKYGLAYRGGQLKLDNKWEKSYMDDYSHKVFDYLGIKTEIELRGGFDHVESQISERVNNIYINGIGYEQILSMNEEQKEQYKKLFISLTDISTYPIYFHCSWGADRTGVLAFLISSLLGVSYDNISSEYELTSLSGSGRRSRITFPWRDMYPELKEKFGKHLGFKELMEKYFTDYIGITKEQIDSIRKIMLEDVNSKQVVHKVSYRVDGKIYVETNVYDGGYVSMIEPVVDIGKDLECWMIDGLPYDWSLPVHKDLVLDAKFEKVEYEEYDKLSLKDLGLGLSYDLKEAKDFVYNMKVKNGSRVFSFDYKIQCSDNIFDDGVHIEIGTLWDYKAHIWLQNQDMQHIYIKKDSLSISYANKLEYGKTYRIDVGVLVVKNGKNKGKQLLFFKINEKLISQLYVNADLSVSSIGIAGTKGIMYNV